MKELIAQRIFEAAISEKRCWELFSCLIDGGSATVDAETGKLMLITGEQLEELT